MTNFSCGKKAEHGLKAKHGEIVQLYKNNGIVVAVEKQGV